MFVCYRDVTGGWRDSDHLIFLYCMEQYPPDLKNRRKLYIDMMRRHMKHYTRADIVSVHFVAGKRRRILFFIN